MSTETVTDQDLAFVADVELQAAAADGKRPTFTINAYSGGPMRLKGFEHARHRRPGHGQERRKRGRPSGPRRAADRRSGTGRHSRNGYRRSTERLLPIAGPVPTS